MSLNTGQLQALLPEWEVELVSSRLQAIRQMGPRQMVLSVYAGQPTQDWLLDLSAGQSWFYPIAERPVSQTPSAWVMLLRKHLLGQRFQSLRLSPGDRILNLGLTQGQSLVLELTGRHANVFLLEHTQHVLQSWFPDRSQRHLKPGVAYVLPASRTDLLPKCSASELISLPADGSRSRWIAMQHQAQQQYQALRQTAQIAWKQLQAERHKTEQMLQKYHAELEALSLASQWQHWGQLLQGAFGQVKRGQSLVRLPDYAAAQDPEQVPWVEILLDPRLDLAGNIQVCFKRSRKLERAAERALELLPAAEAKAQQLHTLTSELEPVYTQALSGQQPAAADWEKLCTWLPAPSSHTPKKTASAPQRPYRTFISQDGWTIWVGKNAQGNEALTFGAAKGSDLWLHARDSSGSHVVIPCKKNQQVPEQTLLDAATLALHYASQRQDQGEVMISQVHHLRRSKGGKPGQVQVQRFQTRQIRIEPARLQALAQRREAAR